jgi:Heparan-alpha-glucosaminide N-acetyltransferase, catalytic
MAVVMMQGHVFDALMSPISRAEPLYLLQATLHGSTAPGFLFASGFVAGLPRAPLSWTASLRRARRLLFVLAVGYAIHLPYFSLWKTLSATPAQKAALYACDALQVIAVTQLAVLVLQWICGRYWVPTAATLAAIVLVAGPGIWASDVARRLPAPLGAYLDMSVTPSHFPIFPFAAFVLAGAVAGAALGRQDPATRRRRGLIGAFGLIAVGIAIAAPLRWVVDFWGVSPAYALIRIGALLLILLGVEALSHRTQALRPLALLGHETLLVYVLHLLMLYGGVVGASPLARHFGTLGLAQAGGVLLLMLPVVFAAAWAWHRFKARAPHAASLALLFLSVAFVYELLTRPW